MNDCTLTLAGGTIYPLGESMDRHDAIRFEDGRVEALGEDVYPESNGGNRLDLDGEVVLPGFNDAHCHVISVGMTLLESDLSTATSREHALDMLRENAEQTPPGNWVLGFGYDESTWSPGNREYLTREELDEVSDSHPIAAQRVDGHTSTLNSEALARIDFEGAESDVHYDGAEPTGVIVEDAVIRLRRATYPEPEKARRALDLATDRAVELGLTSLQDMAGMTTAPGPGDPAHAAFHAAWREGELPVRIGYYVHVERNDALSSLELASGFGDDRLRVLGLKVFSDGAIGSQTAKLSDEFADDPGNDGQFVIERDEMAEAFAEAADANQQIATHAIGDEAIGVVLDAYEEVQSTYAADGPRLRIEHLELATDDHLRRLRALGGVASMQPNFLQWSAPDGLYDTRLGDQWLRRNNAFRAVVDEGIPLAFGSDTMPFGPLYGVHHAVNAPHEVQRLSVEEAIHAYTRGAAYAEFAEDRKGTLEPGMLGDAVVLDRDPFEHPDEIRDIEVRATIVGGEIVYETGT